MSAAMAGTQVSEAIKAATAADPGIVAILSARFMLVFLPTVTLRLRATRHTCQR
jgi:hypothetical protein